MSYLSRHIEGKACTWPIFELLRLPSLAFPTIEDQFEQLGYYGYAGTSLSLVLGWERWMQIARSSAYFHFNGDETIILTGISSALHS